MTIQRGTMLIGCVLAIVASQSPAFALTLEDDFSIRLDGWQPISGKWAWEEAKLVQSSTPDNYCRIVRDEAITEGTITVEGAATARNSSGDGCVGIVCKYIDKDNWIAIRCGAYKGVFALAVVDGEKRISLLRRFTCEIGRRYACEVRMGHGMILASIDGKPAGVCPDPFKDRAGRPGVYAQSAAEFYRFKVDDKAAIPDLTGAAKKVFASGPRITKGSEAWRLEAVDYSVAPLSPTITSPEFCTLAVYARNKGATPSRITDMALDGVPAADLIEQGRIAWWRAWPETVPPGGLTQVLIKMSSLALREAAQVALKSPVGPYQVRLESSVGGPLEVEFALDPNPAPLRINFIAFAADLRTLHVYPAATGDLVGKRVERVEVNGMTGGTPVVPVTGGTPVVPVTGETPVVRVTGGTPVLRGDTLPLRIELEEPLELAAPTLVTMRVEGGAFAGHAVRAFPSRFPVQIVILGKQPGTEAVKELADLCFTEVGFCGARFEHLVEMKKQGLLYFPYAYASAKQIDRYLHQPERPELTGWWIDEIDGWKKQPRDAQQMLIAADAVMRERGLPLAPYCMNIMAPWSDVGYIELADALSHEYGIDSGIRGGYRGQVDFAAPGDISKRELRTARKPWWPYFRNIEAAVLLDTETKEIVGHYRPIDPREHRLYVYSCLANGAKGALNWNYGVNYLKPPGWLSKEHDAIRLNMTALKEPEAFGVKIPQHLLDGLKAATHECGRVNAELQLLGPLLAMGDVSDLARIVRMTPEKSVRGGPAAHTRAIVCGLDTVVLFAINLNIDSNFNARKPQPVKSYEPVSVDVDLDLPPWLKPTEAFSVLCGRIDPVELVEDGGGLRFSFPELAVSEAVVVTRDEGLRGRIEQQLRGLQAKLEAAGVDVAQR